jgi:hypothetical protein
MSVFSPDAVGHGISFSGVVPGLLRVWRQYEFGRDGAQERPVEDIVSHYSVSDNIAFFSALRALIGLLWYGVPARWS